jgi:hypothetical protein
LIVLAQQFKLNWLKAREHQAQSFRDADLKRYVAYDEYFDYFEICLGAIKAKSARSLVAQPPFEHAAGCEPI